MLRRKKNKSLNISVATSCASVEKKTKDKKVKRQQLNVKTKKKAAEDKSTQHALCSVLAPPDHSHHKNNNNNKKKRRKQVFWNFKLNIWQRTREWDTSGLHQSISLKGAWELASSQWSSRITMGVQREDSREERRERERERERERDRGKLPQSYDLPPMCRGAFPSLSLHLRWSQMSQSRNPVVHGRG